VSACPPAGSGAATRGQPRAPLPSPEADGAQLAYLLDIALSLRELCDQANGARQTVAGAVEALGSSPRLRALMRLAG
jgi:hypothetical protein